jgi:hypothetical protein
MERRIKFFVVVIFLSLIFSSVIFAATEKKGERQNEDKSTFPDKIRIQYDDGSFERMRLKDIDDTLRYKTITNLEMKFGDDPDCDRKPLVDERAGYGRFTYVYKEGKWVEIKCEKTNQVEKTKPYKVGNYVGILNKNAVLGDLVPSKFPDNPKEDEEFEQTQYYDVKWTGVNFPRFGRHSLFLTFNL